MVKMQDQRRRSGKEEEISKKINEGKDNEDEDDEEDFEEEDEEDYLFLFFNAGYL